MTTKFINIGKNGTKDYVIEYTAQSSGAKHVEVGDILKVNRSNVVVTEILEIIGNPDMYGCKTIARFINH